MNQKTLTQTGALLALALAAGQARASVVFNDTFDYSSHTDLMQNWSGISTYYAALTSSITNPVLGGSQTLNNAPAVALANESLYRNLTQGLNGDWSLSVDMMHTSYSRAIGFAITNPTTNQGYFVSWNSSSATSYSGKGFLTIGTLSSAITTWNGALQGTAFTNESAIGSNHMALGFGTDGTYIGSATFVLSWSSATQTLTLTEDGNTRASITGVSGVSGLSRVYLVGNTNGLFDNVVVNDLSVPEPASIVGLGTVCAGILLLKRTSGRK